MSMILLFVVVTYPQSAILPMLLFDVCHKHSIEFILSPPKVLTHPNVVDRVSLISFGNGTSRPNTSETV